MNDQRRYVRRSEFAALQGWSKPYVTELGHKGRLVLSPDGKLVDVDATRALLQSSADPARESTRLRHTLDRIRRDTGLALELPLREPRGLDVAPAADPKYAFQKSRREGALAELAELELMDKRAALVDRVQVERIAQSAMNALRASFMELPAALAPQFAADTDAFAIETKLRESLRGVFIAAAKWTPCDLLPPG
jgi:hypothetical protein